MHFCENVSPNKSNVLVKIKTFTQLSPPNPLQLKFGYGKDVFFIQATGLNKHLSTEMQAHGLIRSYEYFSRVSCKRALTTWKRYVVI